MVGTITILIRGISHRQGEVWHLLLKWDIKIGMMLTTIVLVMTRGEFEGNEGGMVKKLVRWEGYLNQRLLLPVVFLPWVRW